MEPDYSQMSLEELEQLNQQLRQQRMAIREQQLAVTKAYEQKRAEAAIDAKLEKLSPAEHEVLAQRLFPEGIPSQADVGVPGAG